MRLSPSSLLTTAAAIALLATPVAARGQISVLSSTVEEHEAAAGETYTGRIVISNTSTVPQTVRIYQTDYRFSSDGTSNFDDPGTTPRSNASWVTPQSQRVVVPPRSEVTVPYLVNVPTSDSMTGTYWSAIMVESADSAPTSGTGRRQAKVGIDPVIRYAVQVVTHIGSTGTRAVTLEKPAAVRTGTGDAALDVDVVSSGDRATHPTLSIELYDAQGALKGKKKQVRELLYPGSSLRQHFEFGALPTGIYKAVIFADCGGEKVLATEFTIKY